MKRIHVAEKTGVTLLELTLAMAVLAIALGATARTLASYYVALDIQDQRAMAIQHCRTVLGAVRGVRDEAGALFVEDVVAWVESQQASANEPYGDLVDLMPEEFISVDCSDLYTGGTPADPMLVIANSAFPDMLGRPVNVELRTVLTRNR